MPTPRENVAAECARLGQRDVVARCVTLIDGGDADDAFLTAIGCDAARQVLEGRAGGRSGYWPRVWGARALLYAWDVAASPAIVRATGDAHWRVREMAAKVIARHLVGDGLEAVVGLRDDPVPRVRAAAERALVTLTAAGA
ncbi:MAG TPA: hypothetical protein VKR27_00750 [Acidimicrobiales bacterium]|nr:hypothetical protein [Acidimicrobiales bacterium]